MRTLSRVLFGTALLAFVSSPALAQFQPRPGGGGFGGGPLSLLTNKSVQEELKFSDDQKKKAEEVSKKIGELRREKTADVDPEDYEKMAVVMKEVNAAADKALADVLKEEQIVRFKQIRVQQLRLRAFINSDVQKALKLSDEQKDDIKKIREEARKTTEEKTKDLGFQDFQKRREITAEIDKETMGKIASKLSTEQKKTWKNLVGEPFEVKFEGGGRRPGGMGGMGGGTRPGRPGQGQPRPNQQL